MPLLSIIVPVYNAARYLPACLDSLTNQAVEDCEFILVNDGSTDNSLEICQKYAAQDKRFIVLSKPNGGQASARNLGLDNATGKYIGFMDSDDELLDPISYQYAIDVLERQSEVDIVQFPYYKIAPDGSKVRSSYTGTCDLHLISPKEYFEAVEVITDYCGQERKLSSGQWDKVFRREMFDGLRYPEGRIFEDTYLSCDIFQRAHAILLTTKGAYGYYIRGNSTTTSKRTVKAYRDQLDSQIRVLKFFITNGGEIPIAKTVFKKLMKFIVNCTVVAPPLANYLQQMSSLKEIGANNGLMSGIRYNTEIKCSVLLHTLKQKMHNGFSKI